MSENQPETKPRLCISLDEWTELCMKRKEHIIEKETSSMKLNHSDEFIREFAKNSFYMVEHISARKVHDIAISIFAEKKDPLSYKDLAQELYGRWTAYALFGKKTALNHLIPGI